MNEPELPNHPACPSPKPSHNNQTCIIGILTVSHTIHRRMFSQSNMKHLTDTASSKDLECSPPIMHQSESCCSFFNEERRDENGEVVQVGDLMFTDKTLGTGSYATVVLARRINTTRTHNTYCSQQSTTEKKTIPTSCSLGSFNPDISCCKEQSSMSVAAVSPLAHTQELVAVKIFSKSLLKRIKNIKRSTRNNGSSKQCGNFVEIHTALENVEREIALMKMFRHPNVVSLLQVIDCLESDALYVVMEYVPLGEIMTFDPETNKFKHHHPNSPGLTKDGYFQEEYAALFFVDVLHGLAYLHRNCICHRDLKPENILISEKGVAKISDFGVSHYFEEEKRMIFGSDKRSRIMSMQNDNDAEMGDIHCSSMPMHDTIKSPPKLTRYDTDSALEMNRMSSSGILKNTEGTIPFWSPEMCNGAKTFSGYASDMWAAGICLHIFASGRLPFYSDSPLDLFHQISDANVPFDGTSFSSQLKDLLSLILQKDPTERAGVGDCLRHDFCKNARNERIRMLEISNSEEKLVVNREDTRRAFSIARLAKTAQDKISRSLHKTLDHFSTMSSQSSRLNNNCAKQVPRRLLQVAGSSHSNRSIQHDNGVGMSPSSSCNMLEDDDCRSYSSSHSYRTSNCSIQ